MDRTPRFLGRHLYTRRICLPCQRICILNLCPLRFCTPLFSSRTPPLTFFLPLGFVFVKRRVRHRLTSLRSDDTTRPAEGGTLAPSVAGGEANTSVSPAESLETSADGDSDDSSRLSGTAIAGISIAVVVTLALTGGRAAPSSSNIYIAAKHTKRTTRTRPYNVRRVQHYPMLGWFLTC